MTVRASSLKRKLCSLKMTSDGEINDAERFLSCISASEVLLAAMLSCQFGGVYATEISRQVFFEKATYAIWVAGMSRRTVEVFLERATKNGFSWEFTEVGSWDKQDLRQFMENLHGRPVPHRAVGKWEAIHGIAKKLITYSDEKNFRFIFFQGKSKSSDLGKADVKRLVNLKFSYVGNATAQIIVRDMGGEMIKYDRWVNSFINHYRMTSDELEKQLQEHSIPLGLFDIVIWAYCEKFVGKTKQLTQHFEEKFS